jgi:hypothetical protein
MEANFSVNVRTALVISNDEASWSVSDDMRKLVDDVAFVKLQPSRNLSFCKMVLGKHVAPNASLSGSEGYTRLQQLRNDNQQPQQDDDGSAKLFQQESESSKKRKRVTKGEAASARANPKVYEISVDGVDVKVLEAAHPLEAVWVEATPKALSAVVSFLQSQGVQKAAHDAKEDSPRIPNTIKMGAGRYAMRQADGTLKYLKK